MKVWLEGGGGGEILENTAGVFSGSTGWHNFSHLQSIPDQDEQRNIGAWGGSQQDGSQVSAQFQRRGRSKDAWRGEISLQQEKKKRVKGDSSSESYQKGADLYCLPTVGADGKLQVNLPSQPHLLSTALQIQSRC